MEKEHKKVDLITIIEVSQIIGMSRRWVSELVQKGTFKNIRPGKRKILIFTDSLREFLIEKGMIEIAKNLDERILELRNLK